MNEIIDMTVATPSIEQPTGAGLWLGNAKGKPEGGRFICPTCNKTGMRGLKSWTGYSKGAPPIHINTTVETSFDPRSAENFEAKLTCVNEDCGAQHTLWTAYLPRHIEYDVIITWKDGGIVELRSDDGNLYSLINGKMKHGKFVSEPQQSFASVG